MDLPGTIHGVDLPNTNQETAVVSWKKFCVILTGKTYRAHQGIVTGLKSIGQIKVKSAEECDYLLVFCPIKSPTGTEISEALEIVPGGKPIILALMHDIVRSDLVLADSRGQLNNPNIRLTVDLLYNNGQLLPCQRNLNAVSDIYRFLGADPSHLNSCVSCKTCRANRRLWVFLVVYIVLALLMVVIVTIVINVQKVDLGGL